MARLEHTGNITEENDASKHKCSANPMGYTERVLEIPDGEKKAEKFPETVIDADEESWIREGSVWCRIPPAGQDKGGSKTWAFSSKYEHG